MRYFILFLLFLTAPALAANKTPVTPAPAVKAPVTSPKSVVKKDAPAAIKWIDVEPNTRQAIVSSWLELDEATRPPFPLYFEQWMKNGTQPAAAAKKKPGKGDVIWDDEAPPSASPASARNLPPKAGDEAPARR